MMSTGLASVRSPWLVIYCLYIAIHHLSRGNLRVEAFSLTQESSSTSCRNNNNGVLGGGFPTATRSTIRRLELSSDRSGGGSSQRRELFWCLRAALARALGSRVVREAQATRIPKYVKPRSSALVVA
jgi:hypothetical protein